MADTKEPVAAKLEQADQGPESLPWLEELPPRQIVAELDRYIVGQEAAKKAVAIAIRNRWRRSQAPDDIRDEILPNNIIMIGPTGVGKTEIARRLARLAGAPFVKVEASKFTEVGYVGRDVESMVRDLVDAAINMVRGEREDDVYPQAEARAEERLLDLLLPPLGAPAPPVPAAPAEAGGRPLFVVSSRGEVTEHSDEDPTLKDRRERTREKLRALLRDGKLEEKDVEVEITQENFPPMDMLQQPDGAQGPDINVMDWLKEILPKRKKRRMVHVHDARRILIDEELRKLVDMDDVVNEALDRVENHGIIFIDELDKIAGERGPNVGPDVSREGVQRDLLPIVEGSTVQTRYGLVRTDHVLFIAAGAFHVSKPSDLIPELQGRFPIRVELTRLVEEDLVRIMTEPENALPKQYAALCAADGAQLSFTADGIREVARIAALLNERLENIGARRLHTVLTTLLEDTLFDLPNVPEKVIVFDAVKVKARLEKIVDDEDLRRYIL
jgi:ATP-dependent HslUV protease ATP-binding subunit HslU